MSHISRMVDTLEGGGKVFGTFFHNGDLNQATAVGDSNCDFAVIEMEHQGFDFGDLRNTLQWLVNRARPPGMSPTPLVRVPTPASDRNEWIIKQVLDAGVAGVVMPRLETAEEARHLFVSARYPPSADSAYLEPGGRRGLFAGPAARYWGVDVEEYIRQAEPWSLDPEGKLLLMPLIESAAGVKNIEEIVKVPGIGAIWFGEGDLSMSLGLRGPTGRSDPSMTEAQDRVLRACAGASVKVACVATASNVLQRLEQGFDIFVGDSAMVDIGRAAVSG